MLMLGLKGLTHPPCCKDYLHLRVINEGPLFLFTEIYFVQSAPIF